MDCNRAAEWMQDGQGRRGAPAGEREEFFSHLGECAPCALKARQLSWIRDTLRSSRPPEPPPDLTVRLRAVGAHVRASKAAQASAPPALFAGAFWNRIQFNFQDVMRPLALPFATGLCSAIVLFSILMPSLTMAQKRSSDVPTSLSTEATVKNMAPLGFSGEAVVDLMVDGNGRATDYSIVSETGVDKAALRRSIENTLLFTVFTPGTTFGQPMPGKIRLTFRNSAIEVKG